MQRVHGFFHVIELPPPSMKRPTSKFSTNESGRFAIRAGRSMGEGERMSDYRVDTLRLAWLQAFIAVVETNSFSKAARRLKWSQPTVSRYVKELSVWLDKPLFASSTPSSITSDGLEFVETARTVVAMLQQARSEGAAAKSTASTKRKGKFVRAFVTGTALLAMGGMLRAALKGRKIGMELNPRKLGLTMITERDKDES